MMVAVAVAVVLAGMVMVMVAVVAVAVAWMAAGMEAVAPMGAVALMVTITTATTIAASGVMDNNRLNILWHPKCNNSKVA